MNSQSLFTTNRTIKLSLLTMCLLCSFVMQAQRSRSGRVSNEKIPTAILPGVTERDYAVYLPKSYTSNPDKRYPVLYLLHGGSGTYSDWPVKGNLQGFANEIIDSGSACEMIIICPDGKQENTMWFNMENWPSLDHFFQELIPYIDKNYRTIPDKKHRAVAGLSMGGGGSIVYAATRPDMFSAVYAVSAYVERLPMLDGGQNEWLQKEVEKQNCIRIMEQATPQQIEALKDISWFIDCGDDDFTFESNMKLVLAMRKQSIPYQLRIRDGGHSWQYWMTSFYHMLPFVSQAFLRE